MKHDPAKIIFFGWAMVFTIVMIVLISGCASARDNTTYTNNVPDYIDRNPVD